MSSHTTSSNSHQDQSLPRYSTSEAPPEYRSDSKATPRSSLDSWKEGVKQIFKEKKEKRKYAMSSQRHSSIEQQPFRDAAAFYLSF
ncbi:hypothetical protein BU16DRAFT_524208, partial [Lophium mytilinum]